MNKKNLSCLLAFILALTLTQPVQAITVLIDSNGFMSIHQGQILGDSDDSAESERDEQDQETEENETETESETMDEREKQAKELQKEQAQREAEQEKKAQELMREQEKQKLAKEREALKKIKTVSPMEDKQLKVKVTNKKSEVLLTPKQKNSNNAFELQETIETDSLDIELPAGQDDEIEIEDQNETEKIKEMRAQRQQRQDRFRIKTQTAENGEQEVEIESGESKAKLKSAEFVIDPETNQVNIITPSGESHTLIHLPDMAIQRMIDAGLINLNDQMAHSELVVETEDDGTVVYKTKAKEVRRVLGLIPVEFENEVELQDATSETTSTPTDESIFERFLRRISR